MTQTAFQLSSVAGNRFAPVLQKALSETGRIVFDGGYKMTQGNFVHGWEDATMPGALSGSVMDSVFVALNTVVGTGHHHD